MFQSLELIVGQTFEVDDIIFQINSLGYHHAKQAHQAGEYARRGGTIDIYPANFDSPVRIDFDDNKIRQIASINIENGRLFWQHKIVIIMPFKASRSVFSSENPLDPFVDIQSGDYVVHNNHGIGKFIGIERLDVKNKEPEHLVIEYDQGDKLFVPKHDVHLVQKYVGFTKKPPKIYKIGSKEWKRTRTLIIKQIQKTAAELLHIQALRASHKGFAYSPDTEWQKEFEKSFPFEETIDQKRSTEELKKDMESDIPMDRLLCGDVGYGKTEVAMRAVFKAVMDNKQVGILVPTTILAEQHYYNFTQRFKNYPVKIAMLSRFRTKREQNAIIKDLKDKKVDVVIGTHRLLSKDIDFQDLGLIVIDEEQRFGVKAKERLKHFRVLVDVLTLTATPIPRTLYMALSGARDMSVISTPPQNRVPVETHIVEFDEELIHQAVRREINRKGQVFFLHNRVEDIERIAKIITKSIPEARVAIGHGQMSPKLLEEIMLKFMAGDIDVLVCTTIIQSGIDVPNANTLIINRADRFGLSELHQLRGRVGRFNKKAYAYFIVPPRKILSTQSKARLEALEKHSHLGAGFQIAFEDLQLRGAGNLLGKEQHGYIATIGFDLYCRLLKESVEHLKKSSNLLPKNHETSV